MPKATFAPLKVADASNHAGLCVEIPASYNIFRIMFQECFKCQQLSHYSNYPSCPAMVAPSDRNSWKKFKPVPSEVLKKFHQILHSTGVLNVMSESFIRYI